MEAAAGTTALPSARAADPWCWGAREGRPVRSSGRPAAASGAVGAAACRAAAAEATEVSHEKFNKHGMRFFLIKCFFFSSCDSFTV